MNNLTPIISNLPEDKRLILLNSFIEILPYASQYYIAYQYCPKTKLIHVSMVFQFEKFNLTDISDKCKNDWKLHNIQELLDKQPNEMWHDGTMLRCGTPPIVRCIPEYLINQIFPDPSIFHIDGSDECYSTNL